MKQCWHHSGVNYFKYFVRQRGRDADRHTAGGQPGRQSDRQRDRDERLRDNLLRSGELDNVSRPSQSPRKRGRPWDLDCPLRRGEEHRETEMQTDGDTYSHACITYMHTYVHLYIQT